MLKTYIVAYNIIMSNSKFQLTRVRLSLVIYCIIYTLYAYVIRYSDIHNIYVLQSIVIHIPRSRRSEIYIE